MPFVTNDYTGYPYDYKDPAANLDYVVDWTAWLAERGNDTIASVQWTISGGSGVVAGTTGFTPQGLAAIWLSGGTIGQTATIICQITTTAGRTEVRTFHLRIVAK